jgi:signal transduction histidine kinase
MALSTDQKLDSGDLSPTSRHLLSLRDEVIAEWASQVRSKVRGADQMAHPILINTLPAFFDNIAESLTPDYPRSQATSNSTIALDHGSERARMTKYGPREVIHEYQLLRDTIVVVATRNGLLLNLDEWGVVNASIDAAVREAITNFNAVHAEFRGRMAATLSHDMRTPLTVILNSAQLAQLSPDPETIGRVIPKIIENSRRLVEMIDDQLDALGSRQAASLPLTLSNFDLAELVAEVRDQANETRPGQCVFIGGPANGYWCRNSMRRALENILNNAIKYGDGQTIRIRLKELNERTIISIHNSGNPIPPERWSVIFDYLQREGDSDQAGWGIGLPFVRSVAEGHGGSITVDSSAATGTTFTIDVPTDCRPYVQPTP